MKDKGSKKPQFRYNVDLTEQVPDGQGGHKLRYGRARDREYQHLGADAPYRNDGALFDLKNPLRVVMPTNVQIQKGAIIPNGTGSFRILPDKVVVAWAFEQRC